jgi:hypothetical protein
MTAFEKYIQKYAVFPAQILNDNLSAFGGARKLWVIIVSNAVLLLKML